VPAVPPAATDASARAVSTGAAEAAGDQWWGKAREDFADNDDDDGDDDDVNSNVPRARPHKSKSTPAHAHATPIDSHNVMTSSDKDFDDFFVARVKSTGPTAPASPVLAKHTPPPTTPTTTAKSASGPVKAAQKPLIEFD